MTTLAEVCVHSERDDVALELLAAARRLAGAGRVVSLITGGDTGPRADEHARRGADLVLATEEPAGTDPDAHALEALERVLCLRDPDALLVGATSRGRETVARLAQRRGLGCASDCTALEVDDGRLLVERTCLGRFVARQVLQTRPALVSIPPRRFEPAARDARRAGRVEILEVPASGPGAEIVASRERPRSSVRIDRSEIVVAVGRGLRRREDLRLIEDLAAALGGVVGASRPLTDDLQWLEPERKVGLSGVTVKPRLYVACGISGQIEHTIGMREAGVVVAINCDPEAPIMQQADYCVTGDLGRIVPALTEVLGGLARPA